MTVWADTERITPEQERLIETIARETVRRLVASPAGVSIAGTGVDREDLCQEARLAAFKAFRSYDPARGALTTWLVEKARNAVFEGLREADILSRSERGRYKEVCREAADREVPAPPPPRTLLSFEDLVVEEWDEETGEGRPLSVLPRVSDRDIDATPDRLALAEAFDALRGRVSPAAILVADWRLKEEVTLKECARRLKLSESRAHQLNDEARALLQASIEGRRLPRPKPKRRDRSWESPFLLAVARGVGITLAARIADVDPTWPPTLALRDPAFADAYHAAKIEGGHVIPDWRERFLAQVREGIGTTKATGALRIDPSTPHARAKTDPIFRAQWQEAKAEAVCAGFEPYRGKSDRWQGRFLTAVSRGDTVQAAAQEGKISFTTLYKAAKESPEFRRAWDQAKAAARLRRAA